MKVKLRWLMASDLCVVPTKPAQRAFQVLQVITIIIILCNHHEQKCAQGNIDINQLRYCCLLACLFTYANNRPLWLQLVWVSCRELMPIVGRRANLDWSSCRSPHDTWEILLFFNVDKQTRKRREKKERRVLCVNCISLWVCVCIKKGENKKIKRFIIECDFE